jgi:NAD dependent epimerase/dehydratase family enzyme
VGAILHLLAGTIAGPVNVTAPHPVTNAEFTKTLAGVLHRPSVFPIPAFGPKLVLGSELADVLLYEGQRVLPKVLEDSGYTFVHPTLEEAFRLLLDRPAV